MLSVIVPAADGRLSNLSLVLTSLAAQTLARDLFEVIIVSDGGSDAYADVLKMHKQLRPLFIWQQKHDPLTYGTPQATMQPRNRGARAARFPFLIFADSDVVLHPRALEYYAEDFTKNPDRVVCGLYHWLKPMRITPADVRNNFDAILNEQLPALPVAPNAHTISRDPREQMFHEQDQDFVWRATTPAERQQWYPKWLGMFSGNIGWNARLFWEGAGGYWDALAAGAHEDGCSGLQAMCAGIGLSFDARIVGGHINHAFNPAYRKTLWAREIPMINQRFRLEEYADADGPRDGLPSLQTMSDSALKAWGVWDWDPARAGQKASA